MRCIMWKERCKTGFKVVFILSILTLSIFGGYAIYDDFSGNWDGIKEGANSLYSESSDFLNKKIERWRKR